MIKYHENIVQGSEEWLAIRCGILTASEMKLIVTPTLKAARNEKERAHMWELAAQRVNKYVEPRYVGDEMLRGHDDELDAKILYNTHYAPVQDVGFVTNDKWGFTLGFSPDGLIGDDGFIEVKSRRQRFQFQTICEGTMPDDYAIQIQTGYLVTERNWCDFISYSGGMHMTTLPAPPDLRIQEAILTAAEAFEKRVCKKIEQYHNNLKALPRLLPTKRRIEEEIVL